MTSDHARGPWAHDADGNRPGDPACLLRRVCLACGAVADRDPPTVCPQCDTDMPAT